MTMTNRQKILATSEYDTLCRMQQYLNDNGCVCEAITHKPRECPDDHDCDTCIAKFLNEEEN